MGRLINDYKHAIKETDLKDGCLAGPLCDDHKHVYACILLAMHMYIHITHNGNLKTMSSNNMDFPHNSK